MIEKISCPKCGAATYVTVLDHVAQQPAYNDEEQTVEHVCPPKAVDPDASRKQETATDEAEAATLTAEAEALRATLAK